MIFTQKGRHLYWTYTVRNITSPEKCKKYKRFGNSLLIQIKDELPPQEHGINNIILKIKKVSLDINLQNDYFF